MEKLMERSCNISPSIHGQGKWKEEVFLDVTTSRMIKYPPYDVELQNQSEQVPQWLEEKLSLPARMKDVRHIIWQLWWDSMKCEVCCESDAVDKTTANSYKAMQLSLVFLPRLSIIYYTNRCHEHYQHESIFLRPYLCPANIEVSNLQMQFGGLIWMWIQSRTHKSMKTRFCSNTQMRKDWGGSTHIAYILCVAVWWWVYCGPSWTY